MDGKRWLGLALVSAVGALMAPLPVFAQVYKCTGSRGEAVYSQHPCGADAKEIQVRAQRVTTETAGEAATKAAVFRSTDLTDASIAERNCMTAARSSIQGAVNSRVEDYQRQIAALDQQLGQAGDDPQATATREAGVRAQMSGLQQSISAERRSADSRLAAAQQRCNEQRRDRQDSIERRYDAGRTPQDAAATQD